MQAQSEEVSELFQRFIYGMFRSFFPEWSMIIVCTLLHVLITHTSVLLSWYISLEALNSCGFQALWASSKQIHIFLHPCDDTQVHSRCLWWIHRFILFFCFSYSNGFFSCSVFVVVLTSLRIAIQKFISTSLLPQPRRKKMLNCWLLNNATFVSKELCTAIFKRHFLNSICKNILKSYIASNPIRGLTSGKFYIKCI